MSLIRKSSKYRVLVGLVAASVLVAACGSDDSSTSADEVTSDTVLINTASGSVAVKADDVQETSTTVVKQGGGTTDGKTVSTSPNSPAGASNSGSSGDSSASGTDSGSSTNSSTPSSGNSGSSTPTFDDAPRIAYKFTLNAMTIQMFNADNSICVQPCRGYYLGWNANFDDNNRRIIYSSSSNGYKDIIANLTAGDSGDLLVMYQANQSANPQIAARYPFAFNGPVNATYNSGVAERLTYSYNGNSIEILLKGSNGAVCPQPCNGYYLGWNADFNDSDRTITYSSSANGYKDIISRLRVGDSGQLLLMNNGIKGRVPFIYLG